MTTAWHGRREGAVALLTLTRPPINALDQAALDELLEAIRAVEADPEVRALVLTGGLDGLFCTGGDLKYFRGAQATEVLAGRTVFDRIERLAIPTIAAINGHVIGDGLALALACDLRLVSDRATFRMPETAYGFIPGWGTLSRLISLVGRGPVADLLLTGRSLAADRAQAIGLVNEVLPPNRLLDEALDWAGRLATRSPAALRAAKRVLLGRDEQECFQEVWGGPDWQEGIDALLTKRPPAFGTVSGVGVGPDLTG